MHRSRLLAAVSAALLIAACGSDSESGSSATEAPATAAPDPDPPSTDPPSTDPSETDPPPTEPPPTEAPTTTTAPTTTLAPTTTPAPTTTLPPAIVIGEPDADGVIVVGIDGAQLDPLYDQFMSGDDPFYLVHTQQEDIFVGIELYTVFGDGWTGEVGTFPTDCTTHGICVYLDPDGVGPLVGGGPGEGEVTVTQLEGGSVITIDSVTIVAEDGKVYRMEGLTLTG